MELIEGWTCLSLFLAVAEIFTSCDTNQVQSQKQLKSEFVPDNFVNLIILTLNFKVRPKAFCRCAKSFHDTVVS